MRTSVEWKRGESGGSGTYTFSPKPVITRDSPAQKTAVLELPKFDGSIVQTLGLAARKISVQGVITVYPANFDNLVAKKKALEDGISTGVGQLHIISYFGQANSKHIYYKGILDGDIRWSGQTNMEILEYQFTVLCPDPTEYEYTPPPPP